MPDAPAVLILDGFIGRRDQEAIQLLQENNIQMVTLVPHSSHLTQPLDLGIFAPVKSRAQSHPVPKNIKAHSARIIKILDSLIVCTPMNVISAFQQAGIYCKFDLPDENSEDPLAYLNKTLYSYVEAAGLRRIDEIALLRPSRQVPNPF